MLVYNTNIKINSKNIYTKCSITDGKRYASTYQKEM